MDIVEQFKSQVRGKNRSVVLPEGQDARVLHAARMLKDQDLAQPMVLGKAGVAEATAEAEGLSLDGIELVVPKDSDKLGGYTELYTKGRDDISAPVAKRMVSKPLFFGGMMVASGDADTMVAGVASATATVIQAGALTVGFAEGINTPSSYFLMVIPTFLDETDKLFIYADCAVNIDPDAEQLADIALASAMSASGLLSDPARVAMLSFSTRGSASHALIDKVNDALKLARERQPDLAIDGEFQADAAIVPRVAQKKVKDGSDVAGQANVLIFPDLQSGNIAYKLTQYMAGAKAIGPFLQGFAKPISDLSRGATAEDIVATSAILLAQLVG